MHHERYPKGLGGNFASQDEQCSRSEVFATDVLRRAEPLRYDSPLRQELHGDLKVVDTGLDRAPALRGYEVYIKDERQQPSGSYKSSGASWKAMQTRPSDTLVTYSTGNNGAGLSIAGSLRGQRVVVEGTENMSPAKVQLLEGAGAQVHAVHPNFQAAEAAARLRAEQAGHVLAQPFGDPDVVAGQCRIGYELVRDIVQRGLARQSVVIPVPVAGGGLISGIAIPIWQAKQEGRLGEGVRVVAVQPEGTDTMHRALLRQRAGLPVKDLYDGGRPDPDCDALAITEANLNANTMAIAADEQFVTGFHVVSKPDLGRAMVALEARIGGLVEPAAALPFAFANAYGVQFPGYAEDGNEPVTFILPVSGGNKSLATSEKYRLAVAHDDNRLRSEAHLHRPAEWFEGGADRLTSVSHAAGIMALRSGTAIIGGARLPRLARRLR